MEEFHKIDIFESLNNLVIAFCVCTDGLKDFGQLSAVLFKVNRTVMLTYMTLLTKILKCLL